MSQNSSGIFHVIIIATICCIALIGCGHKTDVIYVPDQQQTVSK